MNREVQRLDEAVSGKLITKGLVRVLASRIVGLEESDCLGLREVVSGYWRRKKRKEKNGQRNQKPENKHHLKLHTKASKLEVSHPCHFLLSCVYSELVDTLFFLLSVLKGP